MQNYNFDKTKVEFQKSNPFFEFKKKDDNFPKQISQISANKKIF